MSRQTLQEKKKRRIARTRSRIKGGAESPRLAVFRSNRYISAQLINDETGQTLAMISSRNLGKAETKKDKKGQASLVGQQIAEKALSLGIKRAVFDRRSYQYHGRVRAVAEAARAAGLKI